MTPIIVSRGIISTGIIVANVPLRGRKKFFLRPALNVTIFTTSNIPSSKRLFHRSNSLPRHVGVTDPISWIPKRDVGNALEFAEFAFFFGDFSIDPFPLFLSFFFHEYQLHPRVDDPFIRLF